MSGQVMDVSEFEKPRRGGKNEAQRCHSGSNLDRLMVHNHELVVRWLRNVKDG